MTQTKWSVKVSFTKDTIAPVCFLVNDYDSVLNVIRAVHFYDEVFKIEFWQRKEL